METQIYFDAEYVPAKFCRVKTPKIEMRGNKNKFGRKSSFSVFFPYRTPAVSLHGDSIEQKAQARAIAKHAKWAKKLEKFRKARAKTRAKRKAATQPSTHK